MRKDDDKGTVLHEQVSQRINKEDVKYQTRAFKEEFIRNILDEQLREVCLQPFMHDEDNVDTFKFIDFLMSKGIQLYNDIRFKYFLDKIVWHARCGKYDPFNDHIRETIPKAEFSEIILETPIIQTILNGQLIVDDFEVFRSEFNEAFDECKSECSGEITTYIPGLSLYDNNKWAASLCTVDGQVHNVGDFEDLFTIQSTTKPIFYGIASDIVGADVIHQHVGKEPSGFGFNKIQVGHGDLPHNPLINTGAITISSLLLPDKPMSERFSYIMEKYTALAQGSTRNVTFNNSVYLSEKHNGHRNYAIGYYLKDKGCLTAETNLTDTLELYFQLCSIETDVSAMSVIAGALANGGRNVFTGEQIISEEVVQNMLTLMFSCGMYDYSGEWAFEIGLPAKSGVSGVIMVVIPNIGGIAMWSPLLDRYGNSVRGVKFTKELVKRYTTLRKQNIMHPFSNRSCLLSTVREQQGFNRGIVSAILNPVARSYHTASHHGNTARSYHSYHGNCDIKTAGGGLMRSAFKQLKRFVK